MNLLGNNAVLSLVTDPATAAAVERSTGGNGGNGEASNLSSNPVISGHKSTRAWNSDEVLVSVKRISGYQVTQTNGVQMNSPLNNNNYRGSCIKSEMDFAHEDNMTSNLVHHQHHHQQQQHNLHLQSVDDISDLRPNSLNNILKNNIINSGSQSPGLLLSDINNNSSNDLNLNEDVLTSHGASMCNGNVSLLSVISIVVLQFGKMDN